MSSYSGIDEQRLQELREVISSAMQWAVVAVPDGQEDSPDVLAALEASAFRVVPNGDGRVRLEQGDDVVAVATPEELDALGKGPS